VTPTGLADRIDPTDTVRRAAVLEAPVDDGLLLVDPVRVRAHGLNASAAEVWRATADAPTVAAVIARVTGSGAPGGSADHVQRALEQLADEGVVQVGDREPIRPVDPEIPGAFANVPSTDEPVPAGFAELDWLDPIGPFRGLDVTFDLRTTDPAIRDALAEVWAPLAVTALPAGARVRHYQLAEPPPDAPGAGAAPRAPGGNRMLALDGKVVARTGHAASAVAQVVWHANQLVSTGTDRFLQLHAGAVVLDGATVLLPASMNSGKSTLTTGLVVAGARYVTDETVAVDLHRATVLAYPKPITLDPGSWEHFAGLEPRFVRDHPQLVHGKWYVRPDAIRADAAVAPGSAPDGTPVADLPVGAIVFPAYAPDRPTAIDRIEPVAAAAALAANAFNLVALGQPAVDLVARLASTSPCWSLSAADVDTAVAAIADAATGPATS
jgi:hypothetical protein